MAGSGVYRLRLARKGGGTNPRMKSPSSGKKNTVKVDVNVGSNLDPGTDRSRPYIFQDFPNTPPPLSDEHSARGEAKVANPRRSKHGA